MFDALYQRAPTFQPVAFVDHMMDQVVYLSTNESYRAQRVDEYLTLLWEAHSPQIVGVKVKGFRTFFERCKEVGLLEESQYLPLCSMIGEILKTIVDDASDDRARMYKFAEEAVGDYKLDMKTALAA